MKKRIKDKKKKTFNKELLKLFLISLVLFIIGIVFIPVHRLALAIVLATAPYGYSILNFLDQKKFKIFGKYSLIVSVIVRVILGTFIGVAACPVKIGYSLLDDDLK